ncbi:MAG: phosphomannomutase/phosphoglucomutase [Gammaproteobacteria bacterium]|nr:phosphomannomutase/phosphoglucomutase [Gammaproteobacteria bacterium]
MNMHCSGDIFRAYDVRGIVGKQLGDSTMRAIGRAVATLYPGLPAVAVGYDGRLSSEHLAAALCTGLRASGADVVEIGQAPTPLLYFAAHELCEGSGLMVTGSHNPPEYNGVKMMIGGHTLAGDDIQQVRAAIEGGRFEGGEGGAQRCEVLSHYVARMADDVRPARRLRIAVDSGNGAAGPAAKALFSRMDCELTCLYCDVDGRFPNHHPNPSVAANLAALQRRVRDDGLDIGFAFDGDGDRLGVVDERGEIIWPDRQMMVYARDLLRRNPGAAVIYDVKSSRHLPQIVEQCGGRAYMSRTGHSFIKSMLREKNALLAGEMSGHIFFRDRWYGFDDGLYAAARMMEIVAADGRRCSEIFGDLPQAFGTPEINIHFEREGRQHDFMRRFARSTPRLAGAGAGGRVDLTDGVRVEFDDGWGLVRASNTTPCLVARFEAESEQRLHELQQLFRAELLRVEPALDIPF